jgi:hypothetical protein
MSQNRMSKIQLYTYIRFINETYMLCWLQVTNDKATPKLLRVEWEVPTWNNLQSCSKTNAEICNTET